MSDRAMPAWLQGDAGWLLLLAVALLLLLLAVSFGSQTPRNVAARIQRVRGGEQSSTATQKFKRADSLLKEDNPTLLGGLGSSFAAMVPRSAAVRAKLDRAGMTMAVTDFLLVSLMVGVVVGVGLYWYFGLSALVSILFGLAGAAVLPQAYVRRRTRRRFSAFLASFPDALDLIVRGVRSGLPVAESLNSISREMPQPTGGLFADLCANMHIGLSLSEALAVTGRQLDVAEFRFFSISLVVQQETGGNLAEILQNLSALLRRRQQMRLKIRAMSSEARASAMIIGSLPFLTGTAIYLINPEYMSLLFTDRRGMMLLAAAVCSMGMGLMVMSKMVKFEI